MLSVLWLLAIGSPEGVLVTSTDSVRTLLYQAIQSPNDGVLKIALTVLEILNPVFSTLHPKQQDVLEEFFGEAVRNNNVPGLVKLILENTDELGERCESLEADRIMAILPHTADQLLTWGVTHNRYEFVKLIIDRGRAHITNNDKRCVWQSVTKIAAQQGYRALFRLCINNNVDVDIGNKTAFMHAIIDRDYNLAEAMIGLGEDRLEQSDNEDKTPRSYLAEQKHSLENLGVGAQEVLKQAEALEARLGQKIAATNQNATRGQNKALLKKGQ